MKLCKKHLVYMFLVGFLVVLCLPQVLGATGQVSSFTGQSNPFNITFESDQNKSYFISIPMYSYIDNITYKQEIYDSTCIQEFANVSTACGGLDTGKYYVDTAWDFPEQIIDGNYSSYGSAIAGGSDLFINYTIPPGASNTSIRWYKKDGNNNMTLSVPYSAVWNNQVHLRVSSIVALGQVVYYYYIEGVAGAQLLLQQLGTGSIFYEEAIVWNMSTSLNNPVSVSNISLNISYYNNILNSRCNCLNCSIINSNCNFPISFKSNISRKYAINLTNATYSYGIDNCSNSFNIPSNGTALTVNFTDVNNNKQNVNFSGIISYDDNSYYFNQINTNTSKFCVYPAWLNQSYTSSLQYTAFGTTYYQYPSGYINNITQNLLYYVTSGASETVFTLKDNVNKQMVLEGAMCKSYFRLAGIYTLGETKYSDITGKITFNYLHNNDYQFICSKDEYADYTFTLNPITSATYDIFLNPTATANNSNNFDRISINVMPQRYNLGTNIFNFTILSFYGELTSYSYTLTYPGGTTSNSGTNQAGETLSSTINIVNPDIFDTVQLDIEYTMPIFGTKGLRYFYPINNMTSNTLINPPGGDPTYGMGLIERLMIVIFGAAIIGGLLTMIGMDMAGVGAALLWSGYWCFVSFTPWWAFLPSIFVGMIILGGRSQ